MDGCAVWYSEEGTGRGRSPPRCTKCNMLRCTKCNSPRINSQCTNHRDSDSSPWTYSPGHVPRTFPRPDNSPFFLHDVGHSPLLPPPSADLQYKAIYWWPPRSKIKVISSHRLYVSYLPVNSGNKMLYLCHYDGHRHCVKPPLFGGGVIITVNDT